MRTKNPAAQCAVKVPGASLKSLKNETSLHKVLVPIDFSNRSKKALQYAILFAKQFDASLVLLHVLTQPAAADVEYEDQWKLRLRSWACEFVPAGIRTEIAVTRGAGAIEIVNEAKNMAIDLMVISTHGRMGRARALAGSLAERLVQLAPCPVLVIHEREHDFIDTSELQSASVNAFHDQPAPKFIGADI